MPPPSPRPRRLGFYLRVAKRGELPPTAAAAASKDAARRRRRTRRTKVKGAGSQVDARHQYPFEDVFFIDIPAPVAGQPQLLRRAFAVSPGDYDVYVAVEGEGRRRGRPPPPRSGC